MTRSAIGWTALGLVLALAVACEGPHFGGDFNVSHWDHDRDDHAPLRAVARLDCPETEGDLTRASAAADGRACLYRNEDGAEVELRLAALDGRPAEALFGPLEAELRALVPPPQGVPAPPAPPAAPGEKSTVRLPGLTIEADDERARIRMPGVSIDAGDDKAQIRTTEGDGSTVIVNAADEGAEIRSRRDDDEGVRQSYVLARDDAPARAWHAVGYEARGPKGGPLVIAVIRQRENGDAFDDAKDLVKRNAGS